MPTTASRDVRRSRAGRARRPRRAPRRRARARRPRPRHRPRRSRSGMSPAVVAGRRRLDLGVRDLRQPELVEDRAHRERRASAHGEQLGLGDRLDAGVHLPVALDREPLVEVVGVVVAAAERVVVAGHHRVAGRHEVGAGQELAHQLRGLADRGVRRDRVVARGHLEVEPRGDHVLAEDRPRAAGHREDERDARDRPVLHALRARGAHDRDAARLEVEHRLALGGAHQRLRPRARREAHLDAARRVGRAEERLRPGRVVAVGEDRLGAVHRERLGVRHEPLDRELEVAALLDRALRHHAGPARSASRRAARSRSAARSARRRRSSRSRRTRAQRPRRRRRRAAPGSP